MGRAVRTGLGAVTLAVLWLVPAFGSAYGVQLATEAAILALYATSFNLLLGYGGMLSLGHAAFYGVGGYAVALLVKKAGLASFVGTTALAALAAALAGLVIGFFVVRLSQVYFTMLTLAFGQMLYALASRWYSLTNGDTGIVGLPAASIGPFSFASPGAFYRLTLVVLAVGLYVLWRVVNSPFGLALRAIRENPKRAAFLGVEIRRHQLAAFVIAAAVAGVAGAMRTWYQHSAFPTVVHWGQSADAVAVAILGGHGNFLGPAVGALVYLGLQTYIRRIWEYWSLTLGLILIVLVFFPGGVTGGLAALAQRLAGRGAGHGRPVRA